MIWYFILGSVQDPPDEIVPQPTFTPTSPPEAAPSRLSSVVSAFSADGIWKLRTFLAVLCALTIVLLNANSLVEHSPVTLMFVLDCTLLIYIVLAHRPSKSPNNPLGKISLLKIPLTMFHPASAKWFDTICLSLFLLASVARDILLSLFMTISLLLLLHYYN